MKGICLHFGRLGLSLYGRSFWQYRQFFLLPTVTAEYGKGYDVHVDLEIKLLCFGIGVRFIYLNELKIK